MESALPNMALMAVFSLLFTFYLLILSLSQDREFKKAKERLFETDRSIPMGTQVDPTWSLQTEGEQDPKISRPAA